MIMFLRLLGLLSLFTTSPDAAGIAALHLKLPANEALVKPVGALPHPPLKGLRPFRIPFIKDIASEYEFFIRFNFGKSGRDILCGINRKIQHSKNTLGLLLLEPSGFLKTLIIDRDTLAVIHRSISLPRKELREELSFHGVLASEVKLIAQKLAGLRKTKSLKIITNRR